MNDNQMPLGSPVDLQLPTELHRPTPRPLPRDFSYNPHNLKRKQQTILWVGAGIICMTLHFVPFVKMMSFYFWPFQILFWIGLLMCVVGAYIWSKQPKLKLAEHYVKHAEVAFAEVKEMVKIPVTYHQGSVAFQAIVVKLYMQHPERGRLVELQVKTDDFPVEAELSPKFRVGDHVPVVWYKSQFDRTHQIYDFLEATPESSLQRPPISLLRPVAILTMVFTAITFFVWSVYMLTKYQPIKFGFDESLLPASIGFGLGVVVAIVFYCVQSFYMRALRKNNETAISSGGAIDVDLEEEPKWKLFGFYILSGGGVAVMTTCVFMAGCFAANVLLDKSPASEVPVEITDMSEVTHALLVREFNIEYQMEGVDGKLKLMSTPDHMSKFEALEGMAQVHDGYLGWPWVETIKPIIVDDKNLKKAKGVN